MAISEELVLEELKKVIDPELFVNIVDLGLIYEVKIEDAGASAEPTAAEPTAAEGEPGEHPPRQEPQGGDQGEADAGHHPVVLVREDVATEDFGGLAAAEGRPLLNSVTGEEERLESVLPLVKKHGAAVVAISNDETGISEDPDVRFEVAKKIVERAADYGIPREDVIEKRAMLDQARDMDQLKHPVGVVQRLRQQHFAPRMNTLPDAIALERHAGHPAPADLELLDVGIGHDREVLARHRGLQVADPGRRPTDDAHRPVRPVGHRDRHRGPRSRPGYRVPCPASRCPP